MGRVSFVSMQAGWWRKSGPWMLGCRIPNGTLLSRRAPPLDWLSHHIIYGVYMYIYIYNNNLQKTNIILTYCILHSATVVPVNRLILLLKWKKNIHVNAWINKVITKVSALNGMETIKESRARSAPARTRSCSPPATPSQRRNRCFDHDLIINHPVFLFPLLIID